MQENVPPFKPKSRFRPDKKRSLLIAALIVAVSLGSYVSIKFYSPRPDTLYLLTAPEEVKGKVVTLKKLQPKHFIDFHNMLSNTVRKGLEWPRNVTLSWTIAQLKAEQRMEKQGKILFYCIFDNKDDKLIGAIDIREKNPNDVGQFGSWINEHYWGGGRFREATNLIAKVYFAISDDDDIVAHVRHWNKRSYHALKKCGFKDVDFFYENGEKTRYILKLYRSDVK